MIERIVEFSLRRRLIVMLVTIIVCGYGLYSWTRLNVEAYPEIGDVTVIVSSKATGLAAEEVEQQITIPLERALASTPGLFTIRSTSTFALSLVTMVFKDGVEDYWARQRVLERIAQVSLPSNIQPVLGPLTGPTGEILRYTLESDVKNLEELSEIQRWMVVPALNQVPGVASVANFGGLTRQFQLEIDPVGLERYGLGLGDITSAIVANSASAGGSRITRGEQSYVIRSIGLIRNKEDLGNIVIAEHGGVPVLTRDVGVPRYSHQEREGMLGKDHNPDAIQGVVQMLKGENASQVLKALHARVDELNAQLAAQGVAIIPYMDRNELVEATVSKVGHTVVEGVVLVIVVLIAFLGSPRSAIVVALTIPVSLLIAFIFMNFTRLPANLLSLGSIDFGIIVDGAIIVTEAILRLREHNPGRELEVVDVQFVVGQIIKPIFFATIIIIVSYVPLLGLERVEARLFSPVAYTIVYALFGALLYTLMLVPSLGYLALRRPSKPFHNVVLARMEESYRQALHFCLETPRAVYMATAVAIGGFVVAGATIGRDFLPNLDEGSLWLQVQLPSGISFEKANEMASDLRRAVLEFPEVSYSITQIGRNDDRTDPWTMSHIEAPIGLKPYDQWPAGETKEKLVRRLTQRLAELPGMEISVSQPIIDNVNELVSGAHSALVVKVFGEDLKETRRIANGIVEVLRQVPGTTQSSIVQEPPIPQIAFLIDRAAAARYGINVSDVSNLIQVGVGGASIGQIYVNDRTYDVTVRYPPQSRNSPESLSELFVKTTSNAQIPLSQIAKISLQNGESAISHEKTRRVLTVRVDYADRDLSSYLAEAQKKMVEVVRHDPASVSVVWSGKFENAQRAQSRLTTIVGIVLVLMLLILYFAFGKLRNAALILGIVPLAALGGLLALHETGETLNVATGVGFLALFGVAVQNGVIMVSHLNRLTAVHVSSVRTRRIGATANDDVTGDELSALRDGVLDGAVDRFRSVLLTSTVPAVGMLPAALATGVGSDVQRGLGTVIVGGLLVATLLTLFILPTLYFVIERFMETRVSAAAARESA
ncbi:efflux RND transporter permease subunit [Methylocystis sp. Sn-Cys]|uniref:efflux RND transporter permease subunit n=1 Tax=Methylocystis sp. Sn-Cys TaxID=1701263 RepID=UPI0019248085|nr:CusA/CzcA family heavy metal efflux RND transporter [Methylocystis sp. Sn-Cys]MBL1258863.1 efflux RND transporter permease subunit [Methylocystis sp. Sn-Cys]